MTTAEKEFKDHIATELKTIEADGLFKRERTITSQQFSTIEVDENGHHSEVINFCANNYLGLANHPDCSLLYVFQTMVGVDKLGGVEPWHGHYPLRVDGHGINGKVTPLEVFFNAVTNGGEVYLPLGGACLFIAQNHPPHTVHLVQGNKFTV